jgi:drug/metabolite transporter (DMT)-like permease
MNSQGLAIQLMIGQGVLFAAETAVIHQIGSDVSLILLALIRAVAGLGLALFLARGVGLAVLRTRQLPLQLLRGAVGALYLWVMIYSFGHLPFADATAISYTQAAYIAVFSILILGDPVTRSHWTGAAVGFIGALLIAKPAFADWHGAYLVALLGTSLNGLGFVLNRYLQEGDTATTTMFYANLVPVVLNIPALMFTGTPSVSSMNLWIPAIFLLGPVGMYFGIIAVKHADTATLGPYTFLRLIVGAVGGVVIFHELPDIFSTCGAIFILAGCALSSSTTRSPRETGKAGSIHLPAGQTSFRIG